MTKYVHDFLRSDVQSKTFGHFEGIQHARFFGRKYFPNGNYNKNGYYSYDEDGNRKSERLIKTLTHHHCLWCPRAPGFCPGYCFNTYHARLGVLNTH